MFLDYEKVDLLANQEVSVQRLVGVVPWSRKGLEPQRQLFSCPLALAWADCFLSCWKQCGGPVGFSISCPYSYVFTYPLTSHLVPL